MTFLERSTAYPDHNTCTECGRYCNYELLCPNHMDQSGRVVCIECLGWNPFEMVPFIPDSHPIENIQDDFS